ncbi:hypothetical protein [Streptomyces sp. NPDC094468]
MRKSAAAAAAGIPLVEGGDGAETTAPVVIEDVENDDPYNP